MSEGISWDDGVEEENLCQTKRMRMKTETLKDEVMYGVYIISVLWPNVCSRGCTILTSVSLVSFGWRQ